MSNCWKSHALAHMIDNFVQASSVHLYSTLVRENGSFFLFQKLNVFAIRLVYWGCI